MKGTEFGMICISLCKNHILFGQGLLDGLHGVSSRSLQNGSVVGGHLCACER